MRPMTLAGTALLDLTATSATATAVSRAADVPRVQVLVLGLLS